MIQLMRAASQITQKPVVNGGLVFNRDRHRNGDVAGVACIDR
jgi:hypothetical protein